MSTAEARHIAPTGTVPKLRRDPPWPKVAWLVERRAQILASIAVVAIAAGGILHLVGGGAAGQLVWRAAVALLAAELTWEVMRTILVERIGVDTIALVAMVGSLALDQVLAGAVLGLMFSSRAALEAVASRRARRELTALVQPPKGRPAASRRSAAGGAGRAGPGRRRRGRTHR